MPDPPGEGLGREDQALVADAVGPALVADAVGPALVEGAAGLAWAPGGRPRVAFAFTVAGDRITEIRLLADPERLREVSLPAPDQAG